MFICSEFYCLLKYSIAIKNNQNLYPTVKYIAKLYGDAAGAILQYE